MYSPTRRTATALAISAALLVAGCSSSGDKSGTTTDAGDELFLQPVAAQGPDPFTDSTAKASATPPPVTRTPQPSPTAVSPSATQQAIRSISGSTPGLYGGTQSISSCDVEQQVRFLTGEQAKARAFSEVAGISQASIPSFLRGLTPVQLRGDTRVTNHGYRDGRATNFQSVLQGGTAVLVDNRGMPRVRCACGNPLTPPASLKGNPSHNGQPWNGYHPTKVVVVTPAPNVINNLQIINITNITNNTTNIWIERPIGDDGDRDRVIPPPPTPTPDPTDPDVDPTGPDESDTPSPTDPDESGSASPDESGSTSPDESDSTSPDPTDTDESASPTPDCPSVMPTPTTPGGPTPTIPAGCPVPPPAPTDEEPTDGGLVPPPPPEEPTDIQPTADDTPPFPEDRSVAPPDQQEQTAPEQQDQTVPEQTVPEDQGTFDQFIPDTPEQDTFNG
ncbi:DUF6777 domain-containing protein [Streptomyces sp. NBC_01304]|uniref:DUF6777 domain-containing protein n=1 Tax=Streptomyces sp. NBC_01304 TaxID=2903818 RepID=UPI002E10F45B|nr:hypothetical protein OG430_08205 [Streptomyces sp. NBC_01304]